MKSTTAFGLGIAVGYWLYRDRHDIRAYKKRIEELEKEKENRPLSVDYDALNDYVLSRLRKSEAGDQPPWISPTT